MSKIFLVLVAIATVAHMIRPLGLPGLTRRADAWKLAVAGLAIVVVTAVLRPD